MVDLLRVCDGLAGGKEKLEGGGRSGSGRVNRLGTMDGPFPSDRLALSVMDARRRAFERSLPSSSLSSGCVFPPGGEGRSCSVEARDEGSEGLARGKKRS